MAWSGRVRHEDCCWTGEQALEAFLHACSIHGVTPISDLLPLHRPLARHAASSDRTPAPGFRSTTWRRNGSLLTANSKNRPRPSSRARESLETAQAVDNVARPWQRHAGARCDGTIVRGRFRHYFDSCDRRPGRARQARPESTCRAANSAYRPGTVLHGDSANVCARRLAPDSRAADPDLVNRTRTSVAWQVILPSLQVANELLLDVCPF